MTTVAGLLGVSDVIAQRNYDAKTVETLQGKVLPVEKSMHRQGQLWSSPHTEDGYRDDFGALGAKLVHRQADTNDRN